MSTLDPRLALDDQNVVQGDPFKWTVTIKTTASDGTVTPVDLTTFGTTWAANLRQGSTSMTPAVAFTIDQTNAATGVLVLSLTGTQTSSMASDPTPGTVWTFDLQVTGGTISPFTPYKGTLTVWKVYTHA